MDDQQLKTLAKKMTTLELAIRASEQVRFLNMMATTPEKKQAVDASSYEVAVMLEDARADIANYIMCIVDGEQNVN